MGNGKASMGQAPRQIARHHVTPRRHVTRRAALSLPMPGAMPAGAGAQQAAGSLVVIGRDGWLFPLWDRLDRLSPASGPAPRWASSA